MLIPQSLLSRGAWIEIHHFQVSLEVLLGRSSHEERGLKSLSQVRAILQQSRSSHEERGLKSYPYFQGKRGCKRRSSHEERGLKLKVHCPYPALLLSLLLRGAWIEIINAHTHFWEKCMSLLSRGAWIEIAGL